MTSADDDSQLAPTAMATSRGVLDPLDHGSPFSPWRGLQVDEVVDEYNGRGVRVGVIDSGFIRQHVDLARAYRAELDVDVADGDADATDLDPTNSHGTTVASVLAGGANGLGGSGVARGVDLIGYRVALERGAPQVEAALDHALRSKVAVVNGSFGSTFVTSSSVPILQEFATEARGGLGGAIVLSSGNEGHVGMDTNLSELTNQRYAIVVGGVERTGDELYFATSGESLLISGIASNVPGADTSQGLAGFAQHDGTSFSAPQVSGVIALMLQANPLLGIRDIREILAVSAQHGMRTTDSGVNDGQGLWFERNGADIWNGGGLGFDRDVGFGILDARAAMRLAEAWHEPGRGFADQIQTISTFSGPGGGPDSGVHAKIVMSQAQLTLEDVTVRISFQHPDWTTVRVLLVSPSGTVATLFDGSTIAWSSEQITAPVPSGRFSGTFSINRFMGEDSFGTWRIEIEDSWNDGLHLSDFAGSIQVAGHHDLGGKTHFLTDELSRLTGTTTLVATDQADTLNAAATWTNAVIDLRPKAVSTIDGVRVQLDGLFEHAAGSEADDLITGNQLANRLWGGRGHDTLHGGDGGDLLLGSFGADRLIGQAGNDDLRGEAGNDRLEGGLGNNRLFGGAGNDTLVGAAQADLLDGGAGEDRLRGGSGADVFRLGEGALDGPIDLILDFMPGEDRIDLGPLFDLMSASGRPALVQSGAVGTTTRLVVDTNGATEGGWKIIADLLNIKNFDLSNDVVLNHPDQWQWF
ncbi:MAG TPA: S8 family serine peptidase [Geminicoccus sp.]|uniref:S8 family serine peptidase n=1 Tax=Geminicoccus sp. TaxID=2024832 RepID=UPI002E36223C|nr:S8 family serine peptidase [Geminicoccus sp.]HEX2528402.1 S8 family serine peptidase [Geminicoccus sp.]